MYQLILIIVSLAGGVSQSTTEFQSKHSCDAAKELIVADLKSQTERLIGHQYTIANVKSYCVPKS